MAEPETFSIGEVAHQMGLKTSAIRYYEAVGVLPEPMRESGQRRYTAETVRRLEVLNIAKEAGSSLDEARVLLATRDRDTPAHEELRDLAQRKLPEVEALIERAQAMREWLTTASGCNCETLDVCALFEPKAAAPDEASPSSLELQITHAGS